MAVDIPKKQLLAAKRRGRTTCHATNPEVRGLHELYAFLARRTASKFNAAVEHRLKLSKRNRAPISVARLAALMQNHAGKVACVVGTVTDDARICAVPKLQVCALRVTKTARERIEANGGAVYSFDELALRAPTGARCVLLRGNTKNRLTERHFGRAPGLPRSHTRPYACPKVSH